MRPINLSNIEEKAVGGDFKRLVPGAYPCKVVAVNDNARNEYLEVVVDIVAGEFEGFFSDDFYNGKDYMHRVIMSYKDANLGYLKHNLRMFTESNTGYDAEMAILGGNDQSLVGKVVGCTFREEEYYEKKTSEFKMGSPRPDRFISTAEIETTEAPKPRILKDEQKVDAMKRANESDRMIRAYQANGWKKPDYSTDDTPIVTDACDADVPF